VGGKVRSSEGEVPRLPPPYKYHPADNNEQAVEIYNMWRVASEAYAYLVGHPFLTDTVLHNGKTDNDRQIINKQHTAGKINKHTSQHNKQKKTAHMSLLEMGKILNPTRTNQTRTQVSRFLLGSFTE